MGCEGEEGRNTVRGVWRGLCGVKGRREKFGGYFCILHTCINVPITNRTC